MYTTLVKSSRSSLKNGKEENGLMRVWKIAQVHPNSGLVDLVATRRILSVAKARGRAYLKVELMKCLVCAT